MQTTAARYPEGNARWVDGIKYRAITVGQVVPTYQVRSNIITITVNG